MFIFIMHNQNTKTDLPQITKTNGTILSIEKVHHTDATAPFIHYITEITTPLVLLAQIIQHKYGEN